MSKHIVLILLLTIVPVIACGCSYKSSVPVSLHESEMDDYTKGLLLGELDAQGDFARVYTGYFPPIVAPFIVWLARPEPYGAFLGKSYDYIIGHTEAYQKRARAGTIRRACIVTGCLGGCIASRIWVVKFLDGCSVP